jgi:uncharacterized repeat protein (TIGR03803 family)
VRIYRLLFLALVIAGCGKSEGSPPLPAVGYNAGGQAPPIEQGFKYGAARDETAYAKEKVVFSFNGSDGFTPWCTLLAINGELYGTTAGGGTSNGGTIFKVSKSGQEVTLQDLAYGNGQPLAGLVGLHGWLYGTTSGLYGGYWQAFEIGKSGQAGWFDEFGPGNGNGVSPRGRLVAMNGTLYGTTFEGGVNTCGAISCGTVFAITTSGQERVLYSFKGSPDGNNPISDLVVYNGKLYGTTSGGGSGGGSGIVFEIDTSGNERVVYSFRSEDKDGSEPQGALAAANGKIYGATPFGGHGHFGGTVFEVSLAGREQILHQFNCATGGCAPSGGVIAENGVLYGTTSGGPAGPSYGGTVFELSMSGKLRTLHSFAGYPTDGSTPLAALTPVGRALYGTTGTGGAYDDGTVFEVSL